MKDNYINIRVILDDLTNHPLLRNISLERVVKHTIDFMKIMGCPNIFEEKTEILHIDNYRALLPCDYYSMTQVRYNNYCMRYSTDSFHMSSNKLASDYTYKIQGGVIFTSLKEGDIEISYRAIKTDKDGYPLLPDNSEFTRALELYIKKEYFTVLFDLGKITPQVYQNTLQQYSFAAGACQNEFIRLSIDEMESLTNSWTSLIARANEYSRGFETNGLKERLKKH